MSNELRIVFDRGGEDTTVRLVAGAGRGTEAAPFSIPLGSGDDELRGYLEEHLDLPDSRSVERARRVEARLGLWGRKLHGALFGSEEAQRLLEGWLEGPEPRLLTLVTDDPALLGLPWELLAYGDGPLGVEGVIVRRQPPAAVAAGAPESPAELPLRLLYAVGHGAAPERLHLTTPALLDALVTVDVGAVSVDFCRPATLERLEEVLATGRRGDEPYQVVHLAGCSATSRGHGLTTLGFDAGGEDPSEVDRVEARRLGGMLAAQGVSLVVLEPCRQGTDGDPRALGGVASGLVEAGVGSALALSHALPLEAVRIFFSRCYRDLAAGETLGRAVEAGRRALAARSARGVVGGPHGHRVELLDGLVPGLWQRGEDRALVAREALAHHRRRRPPAAESLDEIRWDAALSTRHTDPERVEALARELRDRHGLSVFLDAWQGGADALPDPIREGIEGARHALLVVSRETLASGWVQTQLEIARARDPRGRHITPLLLDDVELPEDLASLQCVDLRDPSRDRQQIAAVALAVTHWAPAVERLSGGRKQPPDRRETGAFPPPPHHPFQGRGAELIRLERELDRYRAVRIQAAEGMGKTTLAREAAYRWTRTGLFPDGACFVSFERGAGAESVANVLGSYLGGSELERLPAEERAQRARQLFDQHRVLMVWSHFESVLDGESGDPERPRVLELLRDWTREGSGKGRLLLTCGPVVEGREAELPEMGTLALSGLSRPDGLRLLAQVLDRRGFDLGDPRLSREALERLVERVGGHPLSLEMIASQLGDRSPDELAEELEELLGQGGGGEAIEPAPGARASLELCLRRLGGEARQALPWLGLFRGGVFESLLLSIGGMEPAAWEAARRELEAMALLEVEREGLRLEDRPYVRLHRALTGRVGVGDEPWLTEEVRARFIRSYRDLATSIRQAFFRTGRHRGLELMAREEANFRTAVGWAVEVGAYAEAADLGDTFGEYLQRSGRLQEARDWALRLAGAMGRRGYSEEAAGQEHFAAWNLFAQTRASEAVARLERLLERLQAAREFDPALLLTRARLDLARVYNARGHANRAIPIFEEVVQGWEELAEKAEARGESAGQEKRKLAASLGLLASALVSTNRSEEALPRLERAAEMARALGEDRECAAGLAQLAQVLVQLERFSEADVRYEQALEAVRRAGDREMEGALLQHRGDLAERQELYVEAAGLYRQALEVFYDLKHVRGVLQSCNLLGVVGQKADCLAEARAWYEQAQELARQLEDQEMLGATAQNLGVVCRCEGEAAREGGDETAAAQCFARAAAALEESLGIREQRGERPALAACHGQMARVQLLLGDTDRAERHAQQAREIREQLGLQEVWQEYHTLAGVAHERGDETAAAQWERLRDAMLARLEDRHGPPEPPRASPS